MENLSRYFVLSTQQQFKQSQAEFTDFVVESTTCTSIKKSDLPNDLFEHETECLYVFDSSGIKTDDFFLLPVEIDILVSTLKRAVRRELRRADRRAVQEEIYSDIYFFTKADTKSAYGEAVAVENIKLAKGFNMVSAISFTQTDNEMEWGAFSVSISLHYPFTTRDYAQTKQLRIFKTEEDWFFVSVQSQPLEPTVYYRCDGIRGLIKLLEFMLLQKNT